MTGYDDDFFPPARDVPRSRTGRVPQWALDEALGRPVEPVPFRAWEPTRELTPVVPRCGRGSGAGRTDVTGEGRRALLPLAVLLAVATVLAGLSTLLDGPGDGRQRVAMTSPAAPPVESSLMPPLGFEEQGSPLRRPAVAERRSEGQGFRFLRHQEDSQAALSWSPCRPIHYVLSTPHMPVGGAELVHGAVAEISTASGLTFVSDGMTTERPVEDRRDHQPDRYGNRWAPVLIAWATDDEVPDFGVDIAGEASPYGRWTPSGDAAYVSGAVYLDAAWFAQTMRAPGGIMQARAVVLHELGHLVGLAHVNDRQQIMFPRAQAGVFSLGAGDRAGLAALGQGPCQADI